MAIDMSQYKVQTNTFRFKTIGDKIQGTLVGKRITTNALKQGADQLVYDLKVEDGSIQSVFGKPGIDFQMKNIRLGQIVEMVFEKQLPAKQPGFSPANVIQVYADSKIVDQEWLNEQEENATVESATKTFNQPHVAGGPSFMDAPQPKNAPEVKPLNAAQLTPVPTVATTPLADVPFVSPPPSKEAQIKDWAKAKIPGTDDTNFTNKVMEQTGVPYIPLNYDKIIELLRNL